MNNHLKLWVVLVLLAVAGVKTARAQEESWDRAKLDRFFDGGARAVEAVPVAAVGIGAAPKPAALLLSPATGHKRHPAPERWKGMKKGVSEGALLGFMGVLYPAVQMVSEGFGRGMSSHYDGPRGDNGHADLYSAAGWVLGAVLYIPALVVGAAGGIAGGLVGAAAPKAAAGWDAEHLLFDRRR